MLELNFIVVQFQTIESEFTNLTFWEIIFSPSVKLVQIEHALTTVGSGQNIIGDKRQGDTKNLLKCVEDGVLVDIKDSEGWTPLHRAVDRRHIEVVELLLNKNVDVNLKEI